MTVSFTRLYFSQSSFPVPKKEPDSSRDPPRWGRRMESRRYAIRRASLLLSGERKWRSSSLYFTRGQYKIRNITSVGRLVSDSWASRVNCYGDFLRRHQFAGTSNYVTLKPVPDSFHCTATGWQVRPTCGWTEMTPLGVTFGGVLRKFWGEPKSSPAARRSISLMRNSMFIVYFSHGVFRSLLKMHFFSNSFDP